MQHRPIGDLGHRAAERVDLADELRLSRSADRWVARHPGDLRQVDRDERRRDAEASCGESRLAAGVAGAYDDHIVVSQWVSRVRNPDESRLIRPG